MKLSFQNIDNERSEPWDMPDLPDAGLAIEQQSLFGEIQGYIHDAPRVVDLRRHAKIADIELPSFDQHGGNAAVLGVNVTFHLEASGLPYLNAVGLEIALRDDSSDLNKKVACRVLGFLPSQKHVNMVEATIGGTLGFTFGRNPDLQQKTFSVQPVQRPNDASAIEKIGSLDVEASANAKGTLFLSSKWNRPIVEAFGLNNWSARWIFHKESDSFFNRDFDQWCFAVFDENFDPLRFRVRLMCELWTGIVPRSIYSKWQEFDVKIER